MTWKLIGLVALGGAVGSVARFVAALAAAPVSGTLPWGTIVINVVGSFAIGAFAAFTTADGRHPASDDARAFVMIGLCGGFTTFSAFSLQTFDLMRDGATLRAMLNVGLSVVLCLGAVAAGHAAATRLA